MGGKRMNKAEKWAVMVQEFKGSGKSQRVWSAERGIKRSSLRYWLERMDELADGIRFYYIFLSFMCQVLLYYINH